MVAGNHDYIKWDHDAALLEVLEELGDGRVDLFSAVVTRELLGWQIFIAPYARRPEDIEAVLKITEIQERSIFLGHQDLVGQYYGGFKVEKGLDPDLLSAKFRWSFVGHFHESKLVRPNVISVGSPLQLSFGEMGHEVGWWLLDTEREQPLPFRFIKNEVSPEFLELPLEVGQEIDFGDDKNYYRIKAKGALTPEGIAKLKWHRLSFEGVREKLSKERSEIKFSDSAEALIDKYVQARNINGLDEEQLKIVGRRYL
jgi:DNA repair exonuclease SbcCD nuclease subunit